MFVILLAAALIYPAQTCFTKKDERDTHFFHGSLPASAEDTTGDKHTLSGPPPSQENLGNTNHKRENSDELSAKRNEILRRAYELPPLFNYYDILRNENDLMENKRTHGLPPNYLSYPRYFGYKLF